MMDLKCENLNQFVGLCLDEGMVISVWKYCSKGSLQVRLHFLRSHVT